MESLLNHRT